MLKCVELVIALCAFVSGWLAAWYWLKASRVQVDPGWGSNGVLEPGTQSASQAGWIAALIKAGVESARLNRIAATWTAVAAGFTAVLAAMTLAGT